MFLAFMVVRACVSTGMHVPTRAAAAPKQDSPLSVPGSPTSSKRAVVAAALAIVVVLLLLLLLLLSRGRRIATDRR